MTPGSCLGWDIGGAHLKVAELAPDGAVVAAAQYATPLWNGTDALQQHLARVRHARTGPVYLHAVTMTGELVDFFPDRQTGVNALLDVFAGHFPEERTAVYGGTSGFLTVPAARMATDQVASANWLATAQCAATCVGHGVLLDVGSTTTDIVPFFDRQPRNAGWNDQQRLACDELVYTGVVRTPVMALVQRVPFEGRWQNVAAEHFATTADVYRITGELEGGADLHDSADRRGKSVAESVSRLARMLGAEVPPGVPDHGCWCELAAHIAERQLQMIERALQDVLARLPAGPPLTIVGAGTGAFLARKLARRGGHVYRPFSDLFAVRGATRWDVAACAPAVAVAELARRGRLQ